MVQPWPLPAALMRLVEVQADLPGLCKLPALDCICKTFERGRELIAVQQKLIRIADSSELGWSVVAECNAEELAGDFKDERRLGKTKQFAEKKAANKRKYVPSPLPST